jgi:hypothetical protein
MARVEINRCDVCGTDDAPENRVNVRVSGVAERAAPQYDTAVITMLAFGWRAEPQPSHDVDLCQRCGAGLPNQHKRRSRPNERTGSTL